MFVKTHQEVRIKNRHIAIVLVAGVLALAGAANACTAFLAAQGDTVLVGNNEDYFNPRTQVWFVPAAEGKHGRVYFGFDGDLNGTKISAKRTQ
jgi:penicillin V acylase-like amidase (Ntn superfamily)